MTKKNKIKIFLFFLIFVAGLALLIFNESGMINYLKLRNEISLLQDSLNKLDEENILLKNTIDSLENKVPAKIEKIAREKYEMKRPNEIQVNVEVK
ncbi:MAG: septum formation initiator [Chlorobiaceae bacterium]|nr:septum formation initiator [Chlorobiaceae bacterium]MBA4309322.1 septum formation initiator [Chlorobiaceae bacterium]